MPYSAYGADMREGLANSLNMPAVLALKDAGIGATRKPPRFLQPGDVLASHIEGIGTLENRLVATEATA